MAADFYNKLSEEDRRAWRMHPVTEAAIDMLKENRTEAARALLEAPASTDYPVLTANISYHKAINDIIELLERE